MKIFRYRLLHIKVEGSDDATEFRDYVYASVSRESLLLVGINEFDQAFKPPRPEYHNKYSQSAGDRNRSDPEDHEQKKRQPGK